MHGELITVVFIMVAVAFAIALGAGLQDRLPAAQSIYDQKYSATRYFSGLDALRAFAVLAVIWCHVGGTHSITILNHGNKGVDLFFAISGFLVTTLLLREHRRNGRISLKDFYMRRTLRIFPLYYAVLGLYCVLVLLTMRGTTKAAEFWDNLPAFLTYTSNWFVSLNDGAEHGTTFYFAWSLATEEQFYLFWPALIALVTWLTRRNWAPAAAAVLLVCIQVVAASQARPGFLVTVLASLAPAILFGAMFAVLLNNRRVFAALYLTLGHRLAAPILLGALLAALQFEASPLGMRFLMAAFVASVCVREDTVLHGVLRFKPLVVLGTISYGMYLMHMLAANAVRKLLGQASGLDVFILTSALVAVMAFLSYRFFESPILRWKDRFQARPSPAAPVQPAPASIL